MLVWVFFTVRIVPTLKRKNARESCESSFIRSKIRTIARETAFQIALGNHSERLVYV